MALRGLKVETGNAYAWAHNGDLVRPLTNLKMDSRLKVPPHWFSLFVLRRLTIGKGECR
jgi:hypothetical protein